MLEGVQEEEKKKLPQKQQLLQQIKEVVVNPKVEKEAKKQSLKVKPKDKILVDKVKDRKSKL